MQYTVEAHAGGYVVARSRGNGEWIAVQESACYESCRREAIRLNAEQKARQRLEQARLISASLQPRRSLRYFEPDAFA